MANGTYGTKKPANISASDAQLFYHYRPTRGSDAPGFSEWKEGDISWLSTTAANGDILPGMYNLRLPMETFSEKGIYTICIKPKEIATTIVDVSTLTGSFSSVRGIVLDMAKDSLNGFRSNGSLVGYRVEYIDTETGERASDYRIITSCNLAEPIAASVDGGTMQKSIRYRFNDSSSYMFCTVTPSTAPSFKANALPVIGQTGQNILLINTKFNPIAIEVEMVEHDADTISKMLEGAQIRNLDAGLITTFDDDGVIYHQAAYGRVINPDEGIHADFKLPYTDNYIKSEEDKLEKIKNQVF